MSLILEGEVAPMHTCPMTGCSEQVDTAMCGWHTGRFEQNVRGLPRYYVQLAMAMAPGRSGGGDRVAVSRMPPVGINVTARSLQEDMCTLVRRAEADYRRAKAWPHHHCRGRESQRLSAGVHFLERHCREMLDETPFGVDVAFELSRIVGACRSVLVLDRLVHRLPAPCPQCDCVALERESGADAVRCRVCGVTFSEADYARLVLVLASQ